MTTIASIDIGTNTIRMVILELCSSGNLRELDSKRAIVRLGEGIHKKKILSSGRMDQAVGVLKEFLEICCGYRNIQIYAVATSAVREAQNRKDFLDRVKTDLGLDIRVIAWEEEARLTLEGVFWKIRPYGRRVLIFDIGGGSTEFILTNRKTMLNSYGSDLGVVRLTERFITYHPIDPKEYSNLQNYLREELNIVQSVLSLESIDQVIGTAGTVTTLAAIDRDLFPYDPGKIHGTSILRSSIERIQVDLKSKSIKERLKIKALELGREDLIIAGIAIVLQVLDTFNINELTVSEYGLREGIILNQLKALKNIEN